MQRPIYILTIVILLLFQMRQLNAQAVQINMDETHQVIRGFGGMNFSRWIGDLNADQIDKVFGNEPGEIGLSIMRVGGGKL